MPNDCYNTVTIGAEPEVIQMLIDCEFKFENLRPHSAISPTDGKDFNENWYEWSCHNWGTKWDRSEYNLLMSGRKGLQIEFVTAWCPPIELLKYLIKTHNIWVKCEWCEEGGLAGIFIGEYDGEKVLEREFTWEDWCLEEHVDRLGS